MTEAYIYDATRTPRGKGKKNGSLHEITALQLATQQLEAIRDRNNLDTSFIDDVVLGCVSPVGEQGADIARAAALNMIPTTTGAARAVGLVMPDLLGKLDGVSIRVPTPNVSCVDLTFEASRDTTVNEINAAFEAAAAEGALKGVLGTTNEPLVSMDFNHDSRSSIVALDQTKVMEGTMCRILSWYDNEWGFSNRMLDTATQMAKFL